MAIGLEAMEVYVDNGLLTTAALDELAQHELTHAFQTKGTYIIGARLGKNRGERQIKIVDYREEIVSLFKSLQEQLRSRGADIPVEATPREIQHIILESEPAIDESGLDSLVACFEEADYSEHPIGRQHYEMMYLSWKAALSEE